MRRRGLDPRVAAIFLAGTVLAAAWLVVATRPPPHRTEPAPAQLRDVLTSGTFGRDWDGARAGRPWRLVAWREDISTCWQIVEVGQRQNEGPTCSPRPRRRSLRGQGVATSVSSYTGSRDPDEYMFVAGSAGPRVARLAFYGDRGPSREVRLHAPSAEIASPYRYFAGVLPRFDYARLVAYSPTGHVLATLRLCGVACVGQQAVRDRTEVIAFEDAPVTVRSAAAAFAIRAAGDAGLIDRLGASWTYRGISGRGRWLATFEVVRCPPRAHRCAPVEGTGTIGIALEAGDLVVTSAGGDMSAGQRATLLASSAPLDLDRAEWRLVGESIARVGPDEWRIAFALVWTGNTGAPWDYGSMCRPTVHDRRGRVLYRGPDVAFEVRERRVYRLGGYALRIETAAAPARVTVTCDPPRAGFTKDV